MKSFLAHPTVIIGSRLFLGSVFLVSGILKIIQMEEFAISIVNYKLMSGSAVALLAMILPWLEVICGGSILLGLYYRGSTLLVFLMMLLFTGAVLTAIFRGLDISCGCFTQDPAVGKVGWMKILENLGLIGVSLILLFNASAQWPYALATTFFPSKSDQGTKVDHS